VRDPRPTCSAGRPGTHPGCPCAPRPAGEAGSAGGGVAAAAELHLGQPRRSCPQVLALPPAACLEERAQQQQLRHDAAHCPHVHRSRVVPRVQQQFGSAVPGRRKGAGARGGVRGGCGGGRRGLRAAREAEGRPAPHPPRPHQMVTTTPLFHRGSSGCRTDRASPKSGWVGEVRVGAGRRENSAAQRLRTHCCHSASAHTAATAPPHTLLPPHPRACLQS
jgi:hypothetical protein